MDKLYPDLRDVLITIVLLVLATGMFSALSWLAHYPDGKDWKFAIIVILAVAAIPILFRVLSFLQQTRSVLDIKGIKIDFGKTLTIPGVQLAENLVEKNQPVTDSGTQAVLEVAQQASKSAVVVVDLKDGDAWYKTRLFALTAPALEFGYPRIIVFLATQNASAAAFLGFADALAVANSIMQDQNYKTAFSNAVAKYYQLAAFAKDELRPFNLALVPVVQGEAYDFRGRSSLMALLIHETMHLEPPMQPEPWVKALDLQHLLGDDLHTDKIEDRKRDPEVILRFLSGSADHIALVRGHRFVGLVSAGRVMREVLGTLVAPP